MRDPAGLFWRIHDGVAQVAYPTKGGEPGTYRTVDETTLATYPNTITEERRTIIATLRGASNTG